MEAYKWWRRSGADLERALQEGPKRISCEGERDGWEPISRQARFTLKPILGGCALRTESGLRGPLQRLQNDKCSQRPPHTYVGVLLQSMLPKYHPLPIRSGASINSLSAPSLLLCFICLYFYPHFSLHQYYPSSIT